MRALIVILALLSNQTYADQLVPKFGVEKEFLHYTVGSAERMYALEYAHEMGANMVVKGEVGHWTARHDGRKSSIYAAPSWGYRIYPFKYLVGEITIGAGWIQNVDNINGSHFQFFPSLGAGFADNGWMMQLRWTHVSCWWTCTVNRGRDFVGLAFGINL